MTYFLFPVSVYKSVNSFLIDSYNSRKALGLTCTTSYNLYKAHEKEFALTELVKFILTSYDIVANSFTSSESLETKLKQSKAILVGENHLNNHHRFLFGHLTSLIYNQGSCKLFIEGGKDTVGTHELKYVSKAVADTHDTWEDGKLHSPLWDAIQQGLKRVLEAASSVLIACDASDKNRHCSILESKFSCKVIIRETESKNNSVNIYRKLIFLAHYVLIMHTQHEEEIEAMIKASNHEREQQLVNSIEREPVNVKVITYSGLEHNKADSKTIKLLQQKNISFISLIPKNVLETTLEETQYLSKINDKNEAREKIKKYIALDLNEELDKDCELLRRYEQWVDAVLSNEIKILENLLASELSCT